MGCGDAERSLDFEVLKGVLPWRARIILVGPHALGAKAMPKEELFGPVEHGDVLLSIFPHSYQRYMVQEAWRSTGLEVAPRSLRRPSSWFSSIQVRPL